MSTTSTIGLFWPTNAPGSTARRATKPVTGDVMMVLARLMRSSSSLALDCEFWALARSSEATADERDLFVDRFTLDRVQFDDRWLPAAGATAAEVTAAAGKSAAKIGRASCRARG